MNRRAFLERSSMAALVAAGLPKAIRSKTPVNYPTIYKTETQYGVREQLTYELGLYHVAVQSFNLATPEEKAIGLKVRSYTNSDQTTPEKTGEFKYVITKSDLIDKESNLWKLGSTLDKNISGDYHFPPDYPKDFGFLCIPGSWVKITGKNDSVLVSIPLPATPTNYNNDNYGGGCFLTTACVAHKGLPDDCLELSVLRRLRNEYMIKNKEGQLLVAAYQSIGPAIVQAIRSCENRGEIYEYMYEHMIVPSARLAAAEKYAAAVTHYKIFTRALQEKYC